MVFRYLAQLVSSAVILSAFFVVPGCASLHQQKVTSKDDSPSLVSLGNRYAQDGLLRESVDAYKKALQKEPNNAVAHRNLGIVLVKVGDFQGAVAALEKSMTSFNDNFEANYFLGEAYRAQEKYAEAIFRYKSAIRILPEDPRALKSLAWSYYKIRFYSEALNVTQKLASVAPNDDQTPVILARTKLKLQRENEALTIIRKSMEKAPAASLPYYQSVEAEILYAKGASNEALATYKKALKVQPMLAGALLGAGRILMDSGKNQEEAVQYLERAVRIRPKMYEGHYYLGKALEKSNPQRALKYYSFFAKKALNDPELLDEVKDARKKITALNSAKKQLDNNP